MGYTTDFSGEVNIVGDVTDAQVEYINRLASTRRMRRDPQKLKKQYGGNYGRPTSKDTDSAEEIYGVDGEFFVKPVVLYKELTDESVLDCNSPSKNQPGLWLQWIIELEDDSYVVRWDQNEKFYNYEEWFKYLLKNFFIPWGWKLNGSIEWFGEDREDLGRITIENNVLTSQDGHVAYDPPQH